MLLSYRFSDAADLVSLHCVCYPGSQLHEPLKERADDLARIQYIKVGMLHTSNTFSVIINLSYLVYAASKV